MGALHQSARRVADVGGQLRGASLLGEIRGGLAGVAWRSGALDAHVSASSHELGRATLVVGSDESRQPRIVHRGLAMTS